MNRFYIFTLCIILVFLRLSIGFGEVNVETEGKRHFIFILLDKSNSMREVIDKEQKMVYEIAKKKITSQLLPQIIRENNDATIKFIFFDSAMQGIKVSNSPQGIDEIQVTDASQKIADVSIEYLYQQRKSNSHQQGWKAQEYECVKERKRVGAARGMPAQESDERQAYEAEASDHEFDREIHDYPLFDPLGNITAQKRSQPQAEHVNAHDNGDRNGPYSVIYGEQALPDHLVD